jgi:hypothetical protein
MQQKSFSAAGRKSARITRVHRAHSGWQVTIDARGDLCSLIWCVVTGLFQSRAALQAEVIIRRHPQCFAPQVIDVTAGDAIVLELPSGEWANDGYYCHFLV